MSDTITRVLTGIIVLAIVVFVGIFGLAFIRSSDGPAADSPPVAQAQPPSAAPAPVAAAPETSEPDPDLISPKEMRELAATLTSQLQLPQMIDEISRLDAIEDEPNRTLRYTYTILTNKVRRFDKAAFVRTVGPEVRKNVKQSPEMRTLFEKGITVKYSYFAPNREHIAEFVIKPSDVGL